MSLLSLCSNCVACPIHPSSLQFSVSSYRTNYLKIGHHLAWPRPLLSFVQAYFAFLHFLYALSLISRLLILLISDLTATTGLQGSTPADVEGRICKQCETRTMRRQSERENQNISIGIGCKIGNAEDQKERWW